jgi:ABC-type methionine transport system permease subunit
LRAHHAEAGKAIAAYGTRLARLDGAVARRAEVLAAQDQLVAAAQDELDGAVVEAAKALGVDVAAALLDLTVPEVRRSLRKGRARE